MTPDRSGFVLATSILVLAISVGSAAFQKPSNDAGKISQQRETIQKLEKQLKDARKELSDAKARNEGQLYFHRIALAQREWQAGDALRAMQLLNDCPPSLRGWEWHQTVDLRRPPDLERGPLRGIQP
jgi:hypothetical protein